MELDYPSLRTKALKYGKKRGLNSEKAEDFAQNVIVGFLKGWASTFDQYYVNYLRSEYGDWNTERGKSSPLTTSSDVKKDEEGWEPSYLPHLFDDVNHSKNRLKGHDRAVFVLKYIWGFTGVEIADCFGASKHQVSRWFKKVEDQLFKPDPDQMKLPRVLRKKKG